MDNATIRITEIKDSAISGQGKFATQSIQLGTFIDTIRGELCPLSSLFKRCEELGVSEDDSLQIDDAIYLIPEPFSKIINHSCDPNAGIRDRFELYALREIQVGEEITFDYSTTVGLNDDYEMVCRCHSMHCRGRIAHILTMPSPTLARYLSQDALPNFIKKQLQSIGKLP